MARSYHLPNHPVPAIRMGRLAVSSSEQGKGHGDYLLAHAVARLGLREQLGVRVLLVDALHEKAARFYRAYGFRETTTNSHSLYLPLGHGI
ncbi:GNAT family N-acetyltransferase [Stenotrophomonas sp. AB1(2024)]|uniref:GNAT family N-acetyltransferase n=1 Tax=Stenotrophomonas sp. AB1(2024) TaxID=3132215 RepID=UPI003099C3CC